MDRKGLGKGKGAVGSGRDGMGVVRGLEEGRGGAQEVTFG